MITALIAVALLVVIGVTAVRTLQQRAAARARPGGSPATAIPIESYAEIDVAVRLQTCRCGGHFIVRGEGPASHTGRALRVTHLECRRCQREQQMYFDLSMLRH